jgi:hypothetical protein
VRALGTAQDFNDFLSPYVQTRIWLAGGDPYDAKSLVQYWPKDLDVPDFVRNGALDGTLALRHGVPSPYPITAFPLFVPFALAPWRVANVCWLLAESVSFVVLLYGLFQVTRPQIPDSRIDLLVLAPLLMAPFHTALAVENPVVVAIALATAAVALAEKRRRVLPAFMLACAIAVKPTVVLPFAIFFALRKSWRMLAYTAVMTTGLVLIAAIRLTGIGSWWTSFLSVNHGMFSSGGVNDFSSSNPIRFDLVNLQVVVSQVVGSASCAQYVSFALILIAAMIWLRLRKVSAEPPVLLDLAIASVISILSVYHRFHDAALLVFVVAWAISELGNGGSRRAGICLAAMLPFIVPGAALLRGVARSHPTIAVLSQNRLWNLFIAPHQVWLIAGMLLTLLFSQAKLRSFETRGCVPMPVTEAA